MEEAELVVKYRADLADFESGNQRVQKGVNKTTEEVKKSTQEVKKSSGAFGSFTGVLSGFASMTGITVVGSLTALGTGIGLANEQVKNLGKSMRVAAGSQEAYERNMASLQSIADKYRKSIFGLGEGYNILVRETRGTVNEGRLADQMFNSLVAVSGKIGYTVTDTAQKFSSFIDKMKNGTVDSRGLTDELDKRLYEALLKVGSRSKLTLGELNELFKSSEGAVNSVLPQLAAELENALGGIPQQNAQDLGDKVEYATSKLMVLTEALFNTSGGKSVLTQAAEEAGVIFDALNRINKKHGFGATLGASVQYGAAELLSGISKIGGKGIDLEVDPYGMRHQIEAEGQRKALMDSHFLGRVQNQGKLPSEVIPVDFDALKKENEKRIELAKKFAADRKRALDEIARQEVQDSKERVRNGELEAEKNVREHYENRPSSNISNRLLTNKGTEIDWNFATDKTTEHFSSDVSSTVTALEKLIHVIEQINALPGIDWGAKVQAEKLKKEEKDLAQSAEAINQAVSEELVEAFNSAARATPRAVGSMLGAIAMGGEGMRSVGNMFFQIAAEMFDRVGEALLTASGIFELGEIAISSMNPVVALAGAIASFAAAQMLRSQIDNSGSDARKSFYTGSARVGALAPVGVDNIPINVSANEMILNTRHQRNLYGLINGANGPTGSAVSMGSARRDSDVLIAKWAADDLAVVLKRGQRKLNRLR